MQALLTAWWQERGSVNAPRRKRNEAMSNDPASHPDDCDDGSEGELALLHKAYVPRFASTVP